MMMGDDVEDDDKLGAPPTPTLPPPMPAVPITLTPDDPGRPVE